MDLPANKGQNPDSGLSYRIRKHEVLRLSIACWALILSPLSGQERAGSLIMDSPMTSAGEPHGNWKEEHDAASQARKGRRQAGPLDRGSDGETAHGPVIV